jgi:hypothetical protein
LTQELRELALFATKVEHVAEVALAGGAATGGGDAAEASAAAARCAALEKQLQLFGTPPSKQKPRQRSRGDARRARPPRASLRVAAPAQPANVAPPQRARALPPPRDGRRVAPRAVAAACARVSIAA